MFSEASERKGHLLFSLCSCSVTTKTTRKKGRTFGFAWDARQKNRCSSAVPLQRARAHQWLPLARAVSLRKVISQEKTRTYHFRPGADLEKERHRHEQRQALGLLGYSWGGLRQWALVFSSPLEGYGLGSSGTPFHNSIPLWPASLGPHELLWTLWRPSAAHSSAWLEGRDHFLKHSSFPCAFPLKVPPQSSGAGWWTEGKGP